MRGFKTLLFITVALLIWYGIDSSMAAHGMAFIQPIS